MMYVSHGDTIIFRREPQERPGSSTRLRPRFDEHTERTGHRLEAWDGLRARVAELEDRIRQLEARLQRVGPGHHGEPVVWRSDAPEPKRAERRDGHRPASGVRVTAHAGDGATVSIGEVRVYGRD